MKIKVTYKVKDEPKKSVYLTSEEYFDSLDEGENYENHGIAKFNYTEEYLNISTSMLEWAEIEIIKAKIGHKIRTQYSDDGKSRMTQRRDLDGHEEIIVSSQLTNLDMHIVRIHKENKTWQLNYNGVITDLADGSQKEKKIF